MEIRTLREKVVQMNVARDRRRQTPDTTAPVVAVEGVAARDVEALEAVIRAEGFALFTTEGRRDPPGAETITPDLVVMDVAQPEVADAIEARLRTCRSLWKTPIICLVPVSDHLPPQVIAQLSADDYLVKPVRVFELANRIRIALQRWPATEGAPTIERRNHLRRREDRRAVPPAGAANAFAVDEWNKTVMMEGRGLKLSPTEYELFHLLYSNIGRIVSADEIIGRVWEGADRADASNVQQYVHMLRCKIEPDPKKPRWIVTVRGFGYKLVLRNEG